MHIDLHRAYRHPVAVIRVENSGSESAPELEIVTHVHDNCNDETASFISPNYVRHELDVAQRGGAEKLRSIPIRVEFDEPEHVMRAQFVKWSAHERGHPICSGNGRVANQTNFATKLQEKVRCLGPARCAFSALGETPCMIDVRINALLGEEPVEIRANSENGFLAMLSGLEYAKAKSDGLLSRANLELRTWRKSTRGSSYQEFTATTLEFAGKDQGRPSTSKSLAEYGQKLLMQWESRFGVTESDLPALPLPTLPEALLRKFTEFALVPVHPRLKSMESPINTDVRQEQLNAIFREAVRCTNE